MLESVLTPSDAADPGAIIQSRHDSSAPDRIPLVNITAGVAASGTKDLARSPIVLVPCFGLTDAITERLLETVYRTQLVSMGFRPLLFTDTDTFSLARPYGWVVEHHMSELHWKMVGASGDWLTSVCDRAHYLLEFFGGALVANPDPRSGHRDLVDRLSVLTGVDMRHMVSRDDATADSRTVRGWRGWLRDVGALTSTYVVETSSGVISSVSAKRGEENHVLVVDQAASGEPITQQILDWAATEGWSVVQVDALMQMDVVERSLCLAAFRAAFAQKGLLCTLTDHSAQRASTKDQVLGHRLTLTHRNGLLLHSGKPISFDELRTRAVVAQASRLLVRSSGGKPGRNRARA